ncbi:MAG: GxxExxY protein [Candidatus Aminicenantes bacterium]
MKFEMEKEIPVNYKGIDIDCGYRIDLLVENQLKALKDLFYKIFVSFVCFVVKISFKGDS